MAPGASARALPPVIDDGFVRAVAESNRVDYVASLCMAGGAPHADFGVEQRWLPSRIGFRRMTAATEREVFESVGTLKQRIRPGLTMQ
jgi:hypothetical protein